MLIRIPNRHTRKKSSFLVEQIRCTTPLLWPGTWCTSALGKAGSSTARRTRSGLCTRPTRRPWPPPLPTIRPLSLVSSGHARASSLVDNCAASALSLVPFLHPEHWASYMFTCSFCLPKLTHWLVPVSWAPSLVNFCLGLSYWWVPQQP